MAAILDFKMAAMKIAHILQEVQLNIQSLQKNNCNGVVSIGPSMIYLDISKTHFTRIEQGHVDLYLIGMGVHHGGLPMFYLSSKCHIVDSSGDRDSLLVSISMFL